MFRKWFALPVLALGVQVALSATAQARTILDMAGYGWYWRNRRLVELAAG
jgi:hypothetical protein